MRSVAKTGLCLLSLAGGSRAFSGMSPSGLRSFYDIKEESATGEAVDFAKFKGKVVYAVNVASK